MKKKGIITALAAALCVAVFAQTAMAATRVASYAELVQAINNGDAEIVFTNSFEAADYITITKDTVIDMNKNFISRTCQGDSSIFYITEGMLTLQNGTLQATKNSAEDQPMGVWVWPNDGSASGVILENVVIDSDTFGVVAHGNLSAGATTGKDVQDRASVIVKGKTNIVAGETGIFMKGKTVEVTVQDGIVSGERYGIAGNGQNDSNNNYGGSIVNIEGGTVKSTSAYGCGIYQPQYGELNISGGTISGPEGVQVKSGVVNITGGVIEATGDFNDEYEQVSLNGGPIETGSALSIISEGGSTGSYEGDIAVSISGDAQLTSTNGYAVVEANVSGTDESKFDKLDISGGTLTGAEAKGVMAMQNATAENTAITGGTFSSDPNTCPGMTDANIAEGTMENGKYVISTPAPAPSTPQHSGGGSGGCSAGFSALALLAVVPLLRMRKK